MQYKVNKTKCIGCGACAAVCPKGVKMEQDGKAEVIEEKELKKCGGEAVCPVGAVEKDDAAQ